MRLLDENLDRRAMDSTLLDGFSRVRLPHRFGDAALRVACPLAKLGSDASEVPSGVRPVAVSGGWIHA